jgi:hypothetical protein
MRFLGQSVDRGGSKLIQQGQVFKLNAKAADGQPLWAYRYRLEGRGCEAAGGRFREPH